MLEFDIYDYLKNIDGIATVHPHHIKKNNKTFPLVTVQLKDTEHDDTLTNPAGIAYATYQIDCWSYLLDDVINQAELIRQNLQGFQGVMGDTDIGYVSLMEDFNLHEEPQDGSDNWLFRRVLEYKIKYRESVGPEWENGPPLGSNLSWQGPAGNDGNDGESAYEIAVAEGFSGTVNQWLDSLVGPAGEQGLPGPTGTWSGSTSDDLAEGTTNRYYTTARAAEKEDKPIRSLCTSDFAWSTTLIDQPWSTLTIPSTGLWQIDILMLNSTTTSQALTPRLVIDTAAISGATGTVVGSGGVSQVGATITTGSPTVVGMPNSSGTSTGRFFRLVLDVTTAGNIKLQIAHNNGGGGLKTCKGSFLEARKLYD